MTRLHRRPLALLFALALWTLPAANVRAHEDPPPGSLLVVVNKAQNRLVIVDLASSQVLGAAPTGLDPHEVAVSSDGRRAYVTDYGPPPLPGNTLSVIDLAARQEVRRVTLAGLPRPHGIAGLDNKFYFTAEDAQAVGRYDPAANAVDLTLQTSHPASHMLAVNRFRRKLYTANVIADTVTEIDFANLRQPTARFVGTGPGPEGIAVSPDGAEVWVGQLGDGRVSVIDAATMTVKASFVAGQQPIRVEITPDGSRVIVTDPPRGEVIFYDRATRQELKRLVVGGGPFGVTTSPDGRHAYVGLNAAGAVAVINLSDLTVEKTIPLGSPGLDGLAYVAPVLPVSNPVQDPAYFVAQHYRDFFGREPDAAGLQFWTNEIAQCGADEACREVRRINVSAAFYLSIEFQQTGYLVYRVHHAAYGVGERLRLRDFLADTQRVGRGVVVGQEGWEQRIEQNRAAFLDEFVGRAEFLNAYPPSLSPAQFVDALNQNTAGSLSQTERDALVADLTTGTKTRAQVLRAVAEDADLRAREFNRAFVLMQYFGYLRRSPDDAPNTDFSGYDFWLGKLNDHGGNFITAEMVKSFIVSGEYRRRFGDG